MRDVHQPPTLHFQAMGSVGAVTVIGGDEYRLLSLAKRLAKELEQRWSRFIPSSELCRLNDNAGTPQRVSHDTYLLVDRGVAGYKMTSGRFDPTVLDIMNASGYDRSFGDLQSNGSREATKPSAGCSHIVLDPEQRSVTLPSGVHLDPGGYGKGLAADLIAEALIDAGAYGACVNMGGDVRVVGESPDNGWRVGIANPMCTDDLLCSVQLTDHGVASSNRLMRTWRRGNDERNHLVDPRTGDSVRGLVAATVIAGQAWWAEVLTKVAMVDSATTRSIVGLLGGAGLYVHPDQRVEASPSFQSFDCRASAA